MPDLLVNVVFLITSFLRGWCEWVEWSIHT